MKPEVLLTTLNAKVAFPKHGWVIDSDGCVYLVFPIFRAIWERADPASNNPWSWRDFNRMHYFQKLSFKVMKILSKIARAEKLILSEKDRNSASLEEWAPVGEAETFLPIWIDSFYIYFRMLADRLTEALGPLTSDAVGSFPREYATLLKATETGNIPNDWKLKVDIQSFTRAFRENSDWYTKLVGPIDGTKKGIRDSIIHRLAESKLIKEMDDNNQIRRIWVQFDARDGDVPIIDIFSAIPEIIHSFCNCLSSLPAELWREQNFHIADLTFRGEHGWPAVTRLFPEIS